MRVVVAGGHGRVALLLERLLADRGDRVAGLIRDPGQATDVAAAGAVPVVADLERTGPGDLADRLHGADAIVFAAGAGGSSDAARKDRVDRDAAIALADAAERAGVRRYVLISAMGADSRAYDGAVDPAFRAFLAERFPAVYGDSDGRNPVFAAYLRAKAAAEQDVLSRTALDVTVVRPGPLSNAPSTGRITLSHATGPGFIPRADVAAVLRAVLDTPGTTGQTFEVISGPTAIRAAVAACAVQSPELQ